MIGMLVSAATSRIAGPVAIAGCVVLGLALGVTTLQKNAAAKRADGLHAEIHAPVTGYVARLALCQGNVDRLDAKLVVQNNAVEALQADSDARIARAQAGLNASRRAAADARFRADRLAGATITGATVCDRVADADRQVLEMLR